MIGVLVLTHGQMAEGMLDSCRLFFGNAIPQIKALCLREDESPEAFDQRVLEAIQQLDTGNGVMIFCDLMGGTPSNRCMRLVNDRAKCISGVNLAMLIEFLISRDFTEDIQQVEIEELVAEAKNGIVYLNSIVETYRKGQEG